MPIAQATRRETACDRLAEAIRRQREPEAWCFAAPSALADVLSNEVNDPFDAEDFAIVADWLDAGFRTREAWASEDLAERFPRLASWPRRSRRWTRSRRRSRPRWMRTGA
jgi:hypothetical protein